MKESADKEDAAEIVESDERDALSELVESEARLRALVAATGVAIVCTDDQLRVTEFNPVAERIFGRRRNEVMGHRYSELLPVGLRKKVVRDVERVLRGRSIKAFRECDRRSRRRHHDRVVGRAALG
jgi:PAS domain S-box-containing protein